MVQGQLPLDFETSISVRTRKAQQSLNEQQTELFAAPPNIDIDIYLRSPYEAIAVLGGNTERTLHWLTTIIGPPTQTRGRKTIFPTSHLAKLLTVRPPAKITLDAATLAVARTQWAHTLGLPPLHVYKKSRRLLAASKKWPHHLQVRDAPWTAVTAIIALKIPINIDPDARHLVTQKLDTANTKFAVAGLAGTAIQIQTTQPDLLENLGLPALAYAGEPGTGKYRMPLLAGHHLTTQTGIDLSPQLQKKIRQLQQKPAAVKTPPNWPWTLYPFQAKDASRGLQILETSGGVLLAGDMGSGKTTVSLALVEHLKIWPLLVVAPLAAFSTWDHQLKEIGQTYYLASDPPKTAWETIASQQHNAIIISYDRLHAFTELLETIPFSGLIADEIQRIASPNSRRSRALRQLAASIPQRIGLSGTPLQNKVEDLLPIGAFLNPGEWKPRATRKDLADIYPGDPLEAVAEHLATMMVRRKIGDTGVKLPGKTVRRVLVPLTPNQRQALEALQNEAQEELDNNETTRIHIFAKLMKMRQIVSCPSAAGVPGPNPKVETAIDLAAEFAQMGRKTVLFTANRQTWKELQQQAQTAGLGTVGIWGSSTVAERLDAEKQFHTNPKVDVFIGTLQSCAESLTLSPTGTAWITCDYLYNPAALAQAEARVYRLNQTNNVDIIYLHATSTNSTIDDRYAEILTEKTQLISQIVDREQHIDTTQIHPSFGDLVFLLTGKRNTQIDQIEKDRKNETARAKQLKTHARSTAHRHQNRNKNTDIEDDYMYLLDTETPDAHTQCDITTPEEHFTDFEP